MDERTLQRLIADAQAVADHLLARVVAEDRAAAERIAALVGEGTAAVSLAFTVARDAQAIELLIREPGRTTPIASIPLRTTRHLHS